MTFSQGFFYPFKVICVFTLKPSKAKTKNRLALKGFFVFSFYLNSKVTGLPFKLKKKQLSPFRATLWAMCRFISDGVACACDKGIAGLRKINFFCQLFQKKKIIINYVLLFIFLSILIFNFLIIICFARFLNFNFFIYFIPRNLI